MSEQTITQRTTTCDPATSATKTLLAYGALAGPLYLTVSLVQALTRDGFDLARHQWSLLSNGSLGWIQIATFIVAGLATIAGAVGLHRATGGCWAPRLIAAYGVGLICAGVFRADPALGFPPGTPDGPGEVSWHGVLHLAAAGFGFTCLAVACFVVARRFAVEGRRGWAAVSRVTGVVFLAGFVAVAAGAGSTAANLAFVAAVLVVWAWLTALNVHHYRRSTRH